MKKIKFLLPMLLLCVALVSCEQEEPELSEEYVSELASFLPENYTVGDTVYFSTETGEMECFIVKVNVNDKQVFGEDDYNETTGEITEYGSKTTCYFLYTEMGSAKNNLSFEFIYHVVDGKIVTNSRLGINYKHSQDEYTMTITGDTLRITSTDYNCIMKKNVGIVQVSNMEHNWTLE